jgi:hypothetical protein
VVKARGLALNTAFQKDGFRADMIHIQLRLNGARGNRHEDFRGLSESNRAREKN